MDEQLIGEILNKLKNSGGPASENTAQEILLNLQEKGGKVKTGLGAAGKAGHQLQKSFMGLEQETEKTKKSTIDYDKILRATGVGMTALGGGMRGLTEGIRQSSFFLGEFTQTIVQGLAMLTDLVGDNVDVFRQLASVGAVTSVNINDFRNVAAQAGLDIQTLGDVTASLGPTLAKFGGDAATGASRFAELIRGLTDSGIRDTFVNLGFTTKDIAEGAADYLEIQTQLGRSQLMSDTQLRAGAGEFLMQLDSLSRLTGQQRDMIKDQLRGQANEKRLRLIMNDEIAGSLSVIESIGDPALKEQFVNLFAKGFPESMEEVGIFAQNGMADAINAVRQGQEGAMENLVKILGRVGVENEAASDAQKDVTNRMIAMGNGFFDINALSIPFAKMLDMNTGELKQNQDALKDSRQGMKNLDDASIELKSAFLALFKPLMDGVDIVAGFLAGVIQDLADLLKKVNTEFPLLTKAVIYTTSAIAALGAGALAYKGGKAAIGGVKSLFSGGGGKQKTFMGPLNQVGAGGGGMMAGMGAGLKGLAGGLTAFANPAVVLGAAALGTSIAAIGAGIAGATFLMGGALGKFADGLKAIGDVDGGNLLQVAKGTLALSGAMVAMAGGGTVSAVTGFFGKLFGGGTDNFAKNINNMLNDLDKNKIDVYAKSLSDLGEGMQSIRTGLSSSIGASGSATGDKLDQLNTTMEQILMVLAQGNRYAKITSGATSEIRDYT
jgi:hypothetical protein